MRCLLIIVFFSVVSCSKVEYEFQGTNEDFQMYSSIVQDDYKIYVYLPPNYSTMEEYALIIGLDGDSEFYNVEDIVSDHQLNGDIPKSIFIGIGYGNVEKNEILRNRDYTPSVTSDTEDYETGGAANFYAFIKDELIPELNSRYPIKNERHTILGHSYGGLFSLFALFQDSLDNPFDKFIPVAASFWYDSGEIFKYEEAYFEQHSDLNATIYTTMGSLEGAVMVNSFREMNERMESRNYQSIKFEHHELKKYGHSRTDYISFDKGLAYVFK